MKMKTYSVRSSWRKRGILVKSDGPFFAIHEAVKIDARLTPFTYSVGLASSRHPWGMRFEREGISVDVVLVTSTEQAEKSCRIDPKFFTMNDATRICAPRGESACDAFDRDLSMEDDNWDD